MSRRLSASGATPARSSLRLRRADRDAVERDTREVATGDAPRIQTVAPRDVCPQPIGRPSREAAVEVHQDVASLAVAQDRALTRVRPAPERDRVPDVAAGGGPRLVAYRVEDD